jgi:hypothetical protein
MLNHGTGDEVLDATLKCFDPWHQSRAKGDRTAFDTFQRLLAKSVRPGADHNLHCVISPAQIRSERQVRDTGELAKLGRGHSRTTPSSTAGPIILAVYGGQERVLDGNNRINYWVEARNTDPHVVHVHFIEGDGQFVLLPPVTGKAPCQTANR